MKISSFIMLMIFSFSAWTRSPVLFEGDTSRLLHDKIKFRNGDFLIEANGALNPSLVAVSASAGSLYITSGGEWYRKTDNGSSTNWTHQEVIDPTDITNWNTAYGWGDHSTEGYLKSVVAIADGGTGQTTANDALNALLPAQNIASAGYILQSDGTNTNWVSLISGELDPVFSAAPAFGITSDQVASWDIAYGWGDHSLVGYLTAETDPIYSADPAFTITSDQIASWDMAYGWGDHSLIGYLTAETDPIYSADPAFTITSDQIASWDIAYGWGDHPAETDPVYSAAPASGITSDQVASWDVAYGWGNHASAGYQLQQTIYEDEADAATATYTAGGGVATISSITASAGTYMVYAFDTIYISNAPSAGAIGGGTDLYDATGTTQLTVQPFTCQKFSSDAYQDEPYAAASLVTKWTFTGADRTILFRVRADAASGTPTNGTVSSRGSGKMTLVRIQ
jgi:hypothetical protein